jgi:signal peptidase
MLPTFEPGDQLIAANYNSIDEIQVGDIVIYERPTMFDYTVVHRVVSVDFEENEIITQGDNNTEPDEPLVFEEIIGKVVNANRPARVEKFVIYNQYDKESREFIEALQQKEDEELEELKEELKSKQEELESSEEAQNYKDSQILKDFIGFLGDYIENLNETPIEGEEDKEKSEKEEKGKPLPTKQEIKQLKISVLNSPEYIAYRNKSNTLGVREASDKVDFWKPTMIKTDNEEIRERFQQIETFPVAILNIPESFNTKIKQFVPKKQEYMHKPVDKREITAFEEGINSVLRVTANTFVDVSSKVIHDGDLKTKRSDANGR